MVAAVIHRLAVDHPPLPETGTLRGDLVAGMTIFCRVIERKYPLVGGLLRAIRGDAQLGRLLHDRVVEPGSAETAVLVERARARGELTGDVNSRAVLAVAGALIWHRPLITGAPLDDGFVVWAVDEIILPLFDSTRHCRASKCKETGD